MTNIVTLIAAGVVTMLSVSVSPSAAAQPKQTYQLRSERKPGQIDRVSALLEVGGEVIAKIDGKDDREKISVVCNLAYDEKTLDASVGSAAGWRSIRYYDKAVAELKIGREGLKPTLRPERCLIGVKINAAAATLFSPRGPLTRKELELIDVLGNSLLLDRFLPQEAVVVGQSWRHSEKLMASLLGLDAVAQADMQSRLTKVAGNAARMELAGRVEGALYGVSTDIEMKAKYRFDLRSRRIDWFALLVKERRNASPVTDGVDVVARLQMQISPKAESKQLTDAELKGLSLEPNAELQQLTYESADGGWQLSHDRGWHVCRDRKDLCVLRMLDRGELLSQCNVSSLPKLASGKEVTLTQFQDDLKRALGEDFGEFVEAGQRAGEANYREYRVVVRGKVSELPIQWDYYLITDQHGHQVVFGFTVEEELVEQFGEAGRKLARSLRFIDPKVAHNDQK